MYAGHAKRNGAKGVGRYVDYRKVIELLKVRANDGTQ